MIVLACYAYEVNLPPILINYRPVLVKIWKAKHGPTVKFLHTQKKLLDFMQQAWWYAGQVQRLKGSIKQTDLGSQL